MEKIEEYIKTKQSRILAWILGIMQIVITLLLAFYFKNHAADFSVEISMFFESTILIMILSPVLFFTCLIAKSISAARFLFMLINVANYIGLASDAVIYAIDYNPRYVLLNIVMTFISFLASVAVVLPLWEMVKALYKGVIKPYKNADKLMYLSVAAVIVLLIINLFTGWMYTIDAQGTYEEYSPLALFSVPAIIFMYCIVRSFYKTGVKVYTLFPFYGFPLIELIMVITGNQFGYNDIYYGVVLFCFQFVGYGVMITRREDEVAIEEYTLAQTQKDLYSASGLQRQMLPVEFDEFREYGIDVYARIDGAKEVAGDFYDFFRIDENRTAFVIGDVSGKGIPAALLMATGKTLIQKSIKERDSLADAITSVHKTIATMKIRAMFITLWAGVIDTEKNTLTYVNAAHTRTYVKNKNEGYKALNELHGAMIGCVLTADKAYTQSTVEFLPGDKIFMYTDGVTEARNIRNEMYTTARLEKQLKEHEYKTARQIVESVYYDVKEFQGKSEQFDDITILAVNYDGRKV